MTLYEEAQEKIKDKMGFSRWLCELMELAPKESLVGVIYARHTINANTVGMGSEPC